MSAQIREVSKKRLENIKTLFKSEGRTLKCLCERHLNGDAISSYERMVAAAQHHREQ